MRFLFVLILLSWAMPVGATVAAASLLRIRSDTLQATFDPASSRLVFSQRTSGLEFLRASTKEGTLARVTRVSDPVFGKGQALELTGPDGRKDEVMLYPGLPFVLVRRTVSNTSAEPLNLSREEVLQGTLDLQKPAAEVGQLGTGGWQKGDQALGSYAWLAVTQPQTRLGVVAGWLTHDHGSGILFTAPESGAVRLTARSDLGSLRLLPGKSKELDTLAIGCFADARVGLETWADAVAKVYKIKLPPIISGYCTWYHARASNEKDFLRDTAIAAEKLKPYGFDFMQIDDGWQAGESRNGPDKNFTRVRPGGPYAGGMQPVAEGVVAHGLIAGIWFMPFSGNHDDPWFADKQDFWFKTRDGKPYETHWSGTLIDTSNPRARQYLQEEVRRISDWGYRYFKMDGLHSGLGCIQTYPSMGYKEDNFGDSVQFNPAKSQVEIYREGLKLVRNTAAPGTFLLGCCAPQNMRSYGATFGLVDAMRIGPDNGGDWHGWLTSPRATTAHYFLNGRIWYNDPDPVYLRTSIPLDQVRAMCSWQGLTGSLTVFSDSLASLPDERLEILRRILPAHRALARPVDILENNERRIWLLTDEHTGQRRDVIGLFNWTDQPIRCDYTASYIGLKPDTTYAGYDFWSGETLTFKNTLDVPVAPTSCRVLAVRPLLDRPFLLSTSRHVTQGIVDVIEEQWNARTRTLSGRSRVVGNDPYELRVVAVAPGANWTLEKLALQGAQATIEPGKTEDGLVRAIIRSKTNAEVNWSLRFTTQKTETPVRLGTP